MAEDADTELLVDEWIKMLDLLIEQKLSTGRISREFYETCMKELEEYHGLV